MTKKAKVKIKYHGTRGSIPVSGKKYTGYGGNTTCVSIRVDDRFNIIDAGTGIRQVSSDIMEDSSVKEIKLFFSHTHLDHIQGFPFFVPLYDPSNHIDIYGETKIIPKKDLDGKTLSEERWDIQKILAAQQNFVFFPIAEANTPAKKVYHNLIGDRFYDFGDFQIKTLTMHHPNRTVGFRFEFKGGGSFCFCTDVEHNDEMIQSITEFAQGADVLAYDSQYTQEEYENGRQGWGHSTINVGAKIASDAEVQEYHMIHHDPWHDDQTINSMQKFARKLFKKTLAVPEGHVIDY